MQRKLTEKLINIHLNQDLVLITYINKIFIFSSSIAVKSTAINKPDYVKNKISKFWNCFVQAD